MFGLFAYKIIPDVIVLYFSSHQEYFSQNNVSVSLFRLSCFHFESTLWHSCHLNYHNISKVFIREISDIIKTDQTEIFYLV